MTPALPASLADWRESPRVRAMNGHGAGNDGRYVPCWLQQALRAYDNPVIDAAVRVGNAQRLPVLVYHGVRMHNNLRMYRGKRIIAMTPDPKTAWATACYLNDRLSLDGRDPATYGNIAAIFAGSPADRERPVYGKVASRGDGSTRDRDGGAAWLTAAASRAVPAVSVPAAVPVDPYLTGRPGV